MILVIIFATLLVIGIILFIISSRSSCSLDLELIATPITVISATALVILGMIALNNNADVQKHIYEAEAKRESYQYILDTNDNLACKIYEDILDYNNEVAREKSAVNNPWLNWLHSKEYADALEYVDLGEN